MRSISVLGATGSIGASTLDLIRRNREQWRVVALTANGNAAELAAVILEPMVGSGGCISASVPFLQALREVTRETGVLLIFEEVMKSRNS